MRLGIAPLAIGVAVAAARLAGADFAADTLACLYLTVATVAMTRGADLKAPQRA